jgi:hypothetical protein
VTDCCDGLPFKGGTAFVVEAQGQVWQWSGTDWYSPAPWKEIQAGRHGATFTASVIAACADGDNDPALFAVADGQVYHRNRGLLSVLVAWQDMKISAARVVDIACWSLTSRHVDVFALDADGQIWSNETTDGMRSWAGWHPVNPPPGEARVIAATSRHAVGGYPSNGEGMLLAITADGMIYEGRRHPDVRHGPVWPTWSPLPPI